MKKLHIFIEKIFKSKNFLINIYTNICDNMDGTKCDVKKIQKIISKVLNIKAIGTIPKTTFLLFLLSSDTSFDIETGRDRVAIVINKEKVGITII